VVVTETVEVWMVVRVLAGSVVVSKLSTVLITWGEIDMVCVTVTGATLVIGVLVVTVVTAVTVEIVVVVMVLVT